MPLNFQHTDQSSSHAPIERVTFEQTFDCRDICDTKSECNCQKVSAVHLSKFQNLSFINRPTDQSSRPWKSLFLRGKDD